MKPILLALMLALSPLAAPSADADETAIQGVINQQIDAFLADDFATAFTFASPLIKNIFQTPERFGTMVRQGYPMVWRPEDVRFLELRQDGGRLMQKVMATGPDGVAYFLDYEMIETAEGWQINGVQVLRAPQLGA